MKWHDLLYFSKGERRALLLLLILITTAFILLLLSEKKQNVFICEKCQESFSLPRNPSKSTAGIPAKKFPAKTWNNRKTTIYPEKYPPGTLIELNTTDTISLKKVPGIGSTFANRIIKYRKLLGGYYSVDQLNEVYGITQERFEELQKWFTADTSYIIAIDINTLSADSLIRHPYLSLKQARTIQQLRKQKGRLSGWDNLGLLEEFTQADIKRLSPYLKFE